MSEGQMSEGQMSGGKSPVYGLWKGGARIRKSRCPGAKMTNVDGLYVIRRKKVIKRCYYSASH